MRERKHDTYWLPLGRFLMVIAMVECLLWYSSIWSVPNLPKGWAVLLNLAIGGGALVLLPICLAVSTATRWRMQFSVAAGFAVVIAVAIPCASFAMALRRARGEAALVEAIQALGGDVEYDYQCPLPGTGSGWDAKPPGPECLRQWLGTEFFSDVVCVGATQDEIIGHTARLKRVHTLYLCTGDITDGVMVHIDRIENIRFLSISYTTVGDAGLEYLQGLPRLETLTLAGKQFNDISLERLRGIAQLKELYLLQTCVTEQGAASIREALPNCRVELL